jgi:hypothetical protein
VQVGEGPIEGRLCPGGSYAFACGFVTESPEAGPGGVALFVLFPAVVTAAAAAAAVVAAAADEKIVDLKAKYFAGAEDLECWEMIAHGKRIELSSGRWKEIW